jgi:hypothetical protein
MSLDFNTLEAKTAANTIKTEKGEEGNENRSKPATLPRFAMAIVFLCLMLGLSSVALSLYSIKNVPDSKPVSIQCDPNLLQKIEKQAQVLDEIAKSAKVGK